LVKYLEKIVNSKSKTFLAFCFYFLLGVATASILTSSSLSWFYFYISVIFLLPFIIIFFEKPLVRFLLICIFLFTFGFFNYSFAFPGKNHVSGYNDKEVSFTAVVDNYPEVGIDDVEYILAIDKINGKNKSGKVLLRNRLYPRYNYGDKLRVKCTLKEPEPFKGFRYDMYLANFDVFSICRYAKIEKIAGNKGNFFYSSIFSAKRSMAKQINKLWHAPYSSLMAGLLYGTRGGLGELEKSFNKAGITHIVAISGLHVTIVSLVLMSLCVHCLINRKTAFYLVSVGIVAYVIFTGMSASVLRAGIMGFLVLLAKKLGRGAAIFNVLIFTAVLMVFENPFLLVWNGGFQLSFLATIGLIYSADYFKELFDFVPNLLEARESLAATLAASVTTLPLVAYMFNLVSIVSPLSNILVVWAVPVLIISGFITTAVSYISMPLAQILSWPVKLGLKYMLWVVEFLTSFSFASATVSLPFWLLVLIYICIFYLLYRKEAIEDGLSISNF
jgi:competence protein ComEC